MTTPITQLLSSSLDTILASGATIASGAYALGNAVDNRPATGISGDLGDLRIPIGSVTPAAGAFLTVVVLPAVDSGTTNYASPNSAAAPPPSLPSRSYIASGGAITELVILDIPMPAYSFKLNILNALGVSITTSGVAQLQRRTVGQ